jgi:hypothetical protein
MASENSIATLKTKNIFITFMNEEMIILGKNGAPALAS